MRREAIRISLNLPTDFDGLRADARAGGTRGTMDPRTGPLEEACDGDSPLYDHICLDLLWWFDLVSNPLCLMSQVETDSPDDRATSAIGHHEDHHEPKRPHI